MGLGDDVAHCRLNHRTPDPSFECSSTTGKFKISWARRANAICGLWKFTSAYFFQMVREKSCDYVLIIDMKKIRDNLSWLCRSKARAPSAKIIYSNPASDIVRSVKTTANDQNNNIQRYFHIFKGQKSSISG